MPDPISLFPDLPPKPRLVHRPHTAERYWPARPLLREVTIELLKEGRSDNAVAIIVGLVDLLNTPADQVSPERREMRNKALAMIEAGGGDYEVIAYAIGWHKVDTGLRKMVAGLRYLEKIDTSNAARYRAAGIRDAALEQMAAVMPKTKAEHIGALSMVATQAHTIERNLGGESSIVIEHRVTGMKTFAELKAEAQKALAERSSSPVIEVEEIKTKEASEA